MKEDQVALVAYALEGNVESRLLPTERRSLSCLSDGQIDRLGTLHRSTGDWAVAMGRTDNSGSVEYVELGKDMSFNRKDGVRIEFGCVRDSDDPNGRKPIFMAQHPAIIEYGGKIYLVGDGRQSRVGVVIWIGTPDLVDREDIQGRVVARGSDPRVAKVDNLFVIGAKQSELIWSGYAVRMYASEDLEEWKPFPSPEGLECHDYELCVTKDGLTLVAVAEVSSAGERYVRPGQPYRLRLAEVVYVYDADQKEWRKRAERRDDKLTSETDLKVVPPEATGGELRLIERKDDDTFILRKAAE